MNSILLIEIITEPAPYNMQIGAKERMCEFFNKICQNRKIDVINFNYYSNSIRMVIISEISTKTKTAIEKKKGPRADVEKNIIDKFIETYESNSIIEKITQGDYEYYWAIQNIEPVNTSDLVGDILEEIICYFPWPKSMQWDDSDIRWIRPIRNILCMIDNKIIEKKIGNINTNNHSLLYDNFYRTIPVMIPSASRYLYEMNSIGINVDHQERKNNLLRQVSNIAKNIEIESIPNSIIDIMTYSAEKYYLAIGNISHKYEILPSAVIKIFIEEHLRGIYIDNKRFIFLSHVAPNHIVVNEYEAVVDSRLEDAQFLLNNEVNLEKLMIQLNDVTFHKKTGTLLDRSYRISSILDIIISMSKEYKLLSNREHMARAALLCKCDVLTEIVYEFPKLHGEIGGYYAEINKEHHITSKAISEHACEEIYKLEKISVYGAALFTADKIEMIASLINAGEAPTTSRDPLGIRKTTTLLMHLLSYDKIDIDLFELIEEMYNRKIIDNKDQILEYFTNRLHSFIKNAGVKDIKFIKSVQIKNTGKKIQIAKKLNHWINTAEGKKCLSVIIRANNILCKYDEIDNYHNKTSYEIDVENNIQLLTEVEDHAILDYLFIPCKAIDAMMDNLYINTEDEESKNYRMCLIEKFLKQVNRCIDYNVLS